MSTRPGHFCPTQILLKLFCSKVPIGLAETYLYLSVSSLRLCLPLLLPPPSLLSFHRSESIPGLLIKSDSIASIFFLHHFISPLTLLQYLFPRGPKWHRTPECYKYVFVEFITASNFSQSAYLFSAFLDKILFYLCLILFHFFPWDLEFCFEVFFCKDITSLT